MGCARSALLPHDSMSADADTFYPVVRGLFFHALLLLVGTQAAARIATRRLGDLPSDSGHRIHARLRALLAPLSLLLFALTFARAGLQLWSLKDPSDPLTWEFTKAALLDGTWGTSWLLQTIAAILLVALSLLPPRFASRAGAVWPFLILLALWAQTGMGHAASSFWGGPLGRILQFSHLTGGGIWLGTLAVLAIAVFPTLHADADLPVLAGVLDDFSVLARAGAGVVALSGVLVALKYAGSLHAFLAAPWGRLLLLKVSCLGGVAALGWYNWRIVTPAVVRCDAACTHQLRRAVRVELAIGIVMLGITAFLVATQLPRES
jgi:putative copper export protein